MLMALKPHSGQICDDGVQFRIETQNKISSSTCRSHSPDYIERVHFALLYIDVFSNNHKKFVPHRFYEKYPTAPLQY